MRAVRYDRFGPPDVLHLAELPEPVPGAGQVKLAVLAASLNPLDWKIRDGHLRLVPILARPPRGTGCDIAGEIVAVGGGEIRRHVGERVFGSLSPFGRDGSCADSAVIDADRLVPLPAGVDAASAAATPTAGGTAVQALEDEAGLASGQSLLLTGAAGGVGHFAAQLARHRGVRVVAVCSAANVEFVEGLGADEVVDYARDDVRRRSDRFDMIFDAANALDFASCRHLLTPRGLYLGTAGSAVAALRTAAAGLAARLEGGPRARSIALRPDAAMWRRLADYLARGTLRPHIEAVIGLDGVSAAQARMATGHGRGKTVVIPGLTRRTHRLRRRYAAVPSRRRVDRSGAPVETCASLDETAASTRGPRSVRLRVMHRRDVHEPGRRTKRRRRRTA